MNRKNATDIRNAALEEAAAAIRHRPDTSADDLADVILGLRNYPADPVPGTGDTEASARHALAGLRAALIAGLTRNGAPNRVTLTDGTILEGQGANDWHNLVEGIVAIADRALASSTPWRAYPGASWPDEPVEADHVGSFETRELAMALCDEIKRGGFDDFVIHEVTREVWRRPAGGEWREA